jgi:LytS/YehU family sensor histidine kinase
MWTAIISAVASVINGIIGGVKHANSEYSSRMNRYHDSENSGVLISLIPIVIIVTVIFALLAWQNRSK